MVHFALSMSTTTGFAPMFITAFIVAPKVKFEVLPHHLYLFLGMPTQVR